MIELYYAEDDPAIAGNVKEYLEQRGFKVKVFPALGQLREALACRVPAMVLLDWNMPDGQGDSLCRWIRSRWRELPVIFLTVRGDAQDIVEGFASGADDYVAKPFALEVLHSRIQVLLRRTKAASDAYLSCGGIVLDQSRRAVYCQSEEVILSAAEYQLLLYLMQNKGRTVTREGILAQVWDVKGSYVNDNTLTVTMKRLRDKLHQPACLKTIRSVGYCMEECVEDEGI